MISFRGVGFTPEVSCLEFISASHHRGLSWSVVGQPARTRGCRHLDPAAAYPHLGRVTAQQWLLCR